MGEYGRSDHDYGWSPTAEAPYAGTLIKEEKLGSWGQTFPGITRHSQEDKEQALLYPLGDTTGVYSKKYLPLKDITFSRGRTQGNAEFRSALCYAVPHGTPGLLVQCMNEDEYQYLFYPLTGPIFVDHETGERSTRFIDVNEDYYAAFDRPAASHALVKIKLLPGGTWVPALNLGESPDGGGYGAFVSKLAEAGGGGTTTTGGGMLTEEISGIPDSLLNAHTAQAQRISKGTVTEQECKWISAGSFGGVTMVRRRVCTPVTRQVPDPPPVEHQVAQNVPGFEHTAKQKEAVSFLSYERGGPIHPGAQQDQHTLGVNEDGEACTSGHLWTEALFFRNQQEDGPLDFSFKPFPPSCPTESQGSPIPVHISYDGGGQHLLGGNARNGVWRLWTTQKGRPPGITDIPTYTPTTRPDPDPTPRDKPPRAPITGIDLNPPPDAPENPVPIPPIEEWVFGDPPEPIQTVLGKSGGKDVVPIGFNKHLNFFPTLPGKALSIPKVIQPALEDYETATPALLFSAVREATTQPYDMRFGESEELKRMVREYTGGHIPYVARLQGFGKMNDQGKWQYNKEAGKFYNMPTANGGLWITPPEILRDGDEAHIGTASTTVLAMHPDVRLAWGQPQTDGTIDDGPYMENSGSSGSYDLDVKFLDASKTNRDGKVEVEGLVHTKERSGAPTCNDGYFTLYIDTADSHAYIAWQDGVTTRSLDLGQVT